MNWQQLIDLFSGGISVPPVQIAIALGFTLICSILTILMYKYFYENENIGAGVHRSFLLTGLAITALFLGIQFSLPLSLGLLGSLSIIRFRTPVKDPAEVGFLMMVIAAAIGSATFNFLLVGLTFGIALVALFLARLFRKGSAGGRSSLIITLNNPVHIDLETKLTSFISKRLKNVKLESVTTSSDSASLHYQFNRQSDLQLGNFMKELNNIAAPANINVFIG